MAASVFSSYLDVHMESNHNSQESQNFDGAKSADSSRRRNAQRLALGVKTGHYELDTLQQLLGIYDEMAVDVARDGDCQYSAVLTSFYGLSGAFSPELPKNSSRSSGGSVDNGFRLLHKFHCPARRCG